MNRPFLAAICLSLAVACSTPAASLAQSTTRPAVEGETPAAKADRLIDAGLAYLKSRQNADGSWGETSAPPGISALALRSFALNGQARLDFVRHGYQRLLSFQVDNGGIYRDLLANYNTSIAVSALAADESSKRPHAVTTAPSSPWNKALRR